ncbi:MAG TPA: hypothetical protein VJA22_00190 [Patescibacteria group bacterium]|nr:hypothetical protein [Patescibacteria group bacterium]
MKNQTCYTYHPKYRQIVDINARDIGYSQIIGVDDPKNTRYEPGVFVTMFLEGDEREKFQDIIRFLDEVDEIEKITVLTTAENKEHCVGLSDKVRIMVP